MSRSASIPDSFGHAAGLPTILKRAGYGYYVFMRPQEHEMKLPLLFWWEGRDGSRVLTLTNLAATTTRDAELIRPAATGLLRRASTTAPSSSASATMAARSRRSRYGRCWKCRRTKPAGTALQHTARFLHRGRKVSAHSLRCPSSRENCSIMRADAIRPMAKASSSTAAPSDGWARPKPFRCWPT